MRDNTLHQNNHRDGESSPTLPRERTQYVGRDNDKSSATEGHGDSHTPRGECLFHLPGVPVQVSCPIGAIECPTP
jgi:hypothetical protein